MSGSALSDLSSLMSLGRERDLDMRPVLLRVQTDLFVTARHRDRATIAAFEALAVGLLAAVDDDNAAIIARKLSPVADTPESVLLLLVLRGGEARRAVIEQAPALSELMIAAATGDGGDLSVFLAARRGLAPAEVAELVARDDEAVDLALARNPHLNLPGATLDVLLDRARVRPALAAALLERDDLPAGHQAALYLSAPEGRRAAIRAGVASLASARGHASRVAAAQDCAELVRLAANGAGREFGAQLAAMLRLDTAPQWSFGREECHDLLPLALLAAGVGEEDTVRILLTLEPAIALSVATVFRLVRLFRETERPTAVYLVEAVLGTLSRRPDHRHVPQLQAGDRGARAGATEAAHQRPTTLRPHREASGR